MRPSSMFASFANLRASGDEKMRVAPVPAPWPLVRAPSPPPSPLWGEGVRGACGGGGDFDCWDAGADVEGAAVCWAAPSPRGGEGGDEGVPAPGAFAGVLAADAAAALGSSPSCAITAMS